MPKYLLRVTYTADGIKGLMKDGGTGAVTGSVTVLLTPGDLDLAAKNSGSYSPPGQ